MKTAILLNRIEYLALEEDGEEAEYNEAVLDPDSDIESVEPESSRYSE